MNLKIFQYYLVPHPFKAGQNAIVSDERRRAEVRSASWEFCSKSTQLRPRVLRYLIAAEKTADSEQQKQYFRAVKQRELRQFNRLKLHICMKFLSSITIGYLLYLAPPAFWQPIETVFDTVAHGMSDYAKWWIILFFPIKGLIVNFGTGFQIRLPQRLTENPVFQKIPLIGRLHQIGFAGRWHRINSTSKSTGIYSKFDDSLAEDFKADVEKCIANIEKKYSGPLTQRLEELSLRLLKQYPAMSGDDFNRWNNEFNVFLEDAAESSGSEDGFPWGEVPKLDRLRQDLVYFAALNGFVFSPVHEFNPDTDITPYRIAAAASGYSEVIDTNLVVAAESAVRQSCGLRDFFSKPEIQELGRKIIADYDRLKQAAGAKESAEILDSLSSDFASIRDRISMLHMGINYTIPNEKGRDLPDFYHRLYLIFGKASCDINNGYKRAGWGIRPVQTRRAVRRRVDEALDDASLLIDNIKIRRGARLRDNAVSFVGSRALTGLCTAAVLLFLFGSILSFYTLDSTEGAVLNSLKIGYEEKFLNNEVRTAGFGTGTSLPGTDRELYWHLPPPFTRMQKIRLEEPSEFTVHIVIGESYTDSLWKKFLQKMSGQLGMSFYVAELKIDYVPQSVDVWKSYDADGMGHRRLVRDVSSIAEEWKTEILSDYYEGLSSLDDTAEFRYIYTTYFRELSEKGVIEDYIRRSFSQTVLSTHVYYGSPLERFEPGFITVIEELESRARDYEDDPFMKESMTAAKTVVEETLERIEAQVEIEYGDLRRHPEKLLELVEDPYMHLQELRNFETLWSGVQSYTWHLYNQEKMKGIFEDQYQDPEGRDYIGELKDVLNNDPHLSQLIRIEAIEYEVMDMGVARLNLIQQKWKDII